MIFYLLETNVNMNVHELPKDILLIIILSIVVIFTVVLFNGIHIKFKESEINLGGVYRQFAKRDKDIIMKEDLKKFSDDVDHDTVSNLYELVEEIEEHFEHPLVQGHHCYFTFEKFSSILRSELYKRIRRNNLWEKIIETGKEAYINNIIRDIKIKYEAFQANANSVKCCDKYANFTDIKNDIRAALEKFFNRTTEILIAGMKKKIKKYKESEGEFKTATARKICCDDCIDKNQKRIDKLEALLPGRV